MLQGLEYHSNHGDIWSPNTFLHTTYHGLVAYHKGVRPKNQAVGTCARIGFRQGQNVNRTAGVSIPSTY
jgi:hypothetical protein